jgi:cysteine desulfurase/selenocysteine lyase
MKFDWTKEFPILTEQKVNDHRLVYLDNGATTLKPKSVIDAVNQYYAEDCANIHRGVHTLSERATLKYEAARDKVQSLINAREREEIIFTKGTTDSINLVARSWGGKFLKEGDEVVISQMEHHSNIVPWQMICEERGAKLRVAPMTLEGELDLEAYQQLLGRKTRLVSIVAVSNALGTVNPIEKMIAMAQMCGAKVLVDAAQWVGHFPIDVQKLGVDFLAFSGHKMYGPTGIGVLYGKRFLLEEMPPYQGGGDMIESVTFEKTTYAPLPYKFEAGTPSIASVIGLGAACDFLQREGEGLGFEAMRQHEEEILNYALEQLQHLSAQLISTATGSIRIIGEPKVRSGVISFIVDGVHPHDVGTYADQMGVALRTGHHCAQPVMQFYKVPATVRASFAVYNTKEDVDQLIAALTKAVKFFT